MVVAHHVVECGAFSLGRVVAELTDFADGDRPATAAELARAQAIQTLSLPGAYETASAVAATIGTIVQFKIPRLVINDTVNFGGNEAFLCSHGVDVIDAAHEPSIRQMCDFIAANPALWNEDIME